MAISVDQVYTTVLYIINKNGGGYLTPDNFNKIARLAQLDLLEKAFEDYNRALFREKRGGVGSDYADIPERIRDKIDVFYKTNTNGLTVTGSLIPNTEFIDDANTRSFANTQNDNYADGTYTNVPIIKISGGTSTATCTVIVENKTVISLVIVNPGSGYTASENLAINASSIGDTSGLDTQITFNTSSQGDIATDLGVFTLPTTTSSTTNSAFSTSDIYKIIDLTVSNRTKSIEKIDKHKLTYLVSSPLTAPTETFPVYYTRDNDLVIEPAQSTGTWSLGNVTLDYISVPEDPYYAFTTNTSEFGTPVYTSTGSGVDFTLHPSDEIDLILRILQYSGITINDIRIVQQAVQEKQIQTTQENN